METDESRIFKEIERAKAEGNYLPTPDEIAAECKRIQAEWTPEEELRKRVGPTNQRREWQPSIARNCG